MPCGRTREAAGWNVDARGLRGAPLVRLFVGADAHASVWTAFRYLGFGADEICAIDTDDDGRMSAPVLARALAASEAPAIVVAQAGQINTGAFDPMEEIADACQRHSAWLHVDGAFGLWARAEPGLRVLTRGIERADSWATDGHKWPQAPYDCGFAIVRNAAAHRHAMAIGASYLPQAVDQHEPSHYVPELSRRARGFAVWAIIRALGRRGIAELIRNHCDAARIISERLAQEAGISVVNTVALNQLIVSFGDDERSTRAVIDRLRRRNEIVVEGAAWRDRWVMRISVVGARLAPPDIERLVSEIIGAWREEQREPSPREPAQTSCLASRGG